MKRIIFTTILGLSAILLATSCNNDNKKETKKSSSESVASRISTDNDKISGSLALAFYHQDSIAENFNFYREIDSMLAAKQLDFQQQLEKRARSFQAYQAEVQRRYENDEITGYEIEEVQQTLAQKQQSIENFRDQKGGELQRETMQYQMALMNKISEAGNEFSQKNDIDLLFFYQQGGQITYINKAFDVTEDFIDFLNQREDELRFGFEEEAKSINIDSLEMGTEGFGQ